jgi:DNA-binding NarL/FixJ family response regulator
MPTEVKANRRVFLVDDHPLVRDQLKQLIERQRGLEVCGEADEAPRALTLITELRPDIVVLDISLKRSHGLELIKDLQVHCGDIPILVLSMHEESFYALRALRAGASGYITKLQPTTEVIAAIRRVLEGGVYVTEDLQQQIVQQQIGPQSQTNDPVESLSDRELEVFHLMGKGFGTRRIAEELRIGIKSVEAYRTRIKEKFGARDTTELLFHAIYWAQKLR